MVAVTPVRSGEPYGRLFASGRVGIWWGEAAERPKNIRSTDGFPAARDTLPGCTRGAMAQRVAYF